MNDLQHTFERATLQQRYRGALQAFSQQAWNMRNDADYWGWYGTLCEYAARQRTGVAKRTMLKQAAQYYHRATRLDRNNFLGWHGRWRLSCNRRDRQCVTLFWKAHRVAPRRGHMKCLGVSYLALGKPKQAVIYFQQALREVRTPQNRLAIHHDLAIAFQRMGEFARARRHATYTHRWLQKLPRSVRTTPAFEQTKFEIEKMLTTLSEHSKSPHPGCTPRGCRPTGR